MHWPKRDKEVKQLLRFEDIHFTNMLEHEQFVIYTGCKICELDVKDADNMSRHFSANIQLDLLSPILINCNCWHFYQKTTTFFLLHYLF